MKSMITLGHVWKNWCTIHLQNSLLPVSAQHSIPNNTPTLVKAASNPYSRSMIKKIKFSLNCKIYLLYKLGQRTARLAGDARFDRGFCAMFCTYFLQVIKCATPNQNYCFLYLAGPFKEDRSPNGCL